MSGRINYWRVATIALLTVVLAQAYVLGVRPTPIEAPTTMPTPNRAAVKQDDAWFRQMVDWYYPRKNTEQWEEMFIRDFFRDRRGGFLVDVGASHFREASTTYFLDRHLGWQGIAIDAIAEYQRGYEEHRPRTRFYSFYVADKSDQDVEFFVIPNGMKRSTGVKSVAETHRQQRGLDSQVRHVPTITLNDLLARHNVEKIDLLSMDIELAEPAALAGFDIARYRPDLVVIETHGPVRDQVFAVFRRHGYVAIEKYGKRDARNTYFTPAALYEEWNVRADAWDAPR